MAHPRKDIMARQLRWESAANGMFNLSRFKSRSQMKRGCLFDVGSSMKTRGRPSRPQKYSMKMHDIEFADLVMKCPAQSSGQGNIGFDAVKIRQKVLLALKNMGEILPRLGVPFSTIWSIAVYVVLPSSS
jgi:hypothetical protein